METSTTRIARWRNAARNVSRCVRRVEEDESGSTLALVALSIVILVAFIGLSIDTARGYMLKQRLSYAVDAAALAAAKATTATTTIGPVGNRYFAANFPPGFMNAKNVNVTFEINAAEDEVTVHASAEIPTAIMGVIGVDKMIIGAEAVAQRQAKGLELALALDITGSMGSSMTELRNATNTLIDVLYGGKEAVPSLWVAIVPFNTRVNLADYIEPEPWTDDNPANGMYDGETYTDTNGNDMWDAGEAFTDKKPKNGVWDPGEPFTDDNPANGVYDAPEPYTDTNGNGVFDTPPELYTDTNGNGEFDGDLNIVSFDPTRYDKVCAHTRPSPDEVTETPPDIAPFTVQWTMTCPTPCALGLTAPKTTLKDRVATLVAGGRTRIDEGAAWAYRMLSPEWRGKWGDPDLPLDYDTDQMEKAVIIMTDGENRTQDGTTEDEANQRLDDACTNMKDNGIIVYTVRFRTTSTAVETMLTDCATSPAHYYNASDGGLETIFAQIAAKLSNLRLVN